jgi:hypothetical protein
MEKIPSPFRDSPHISEPVNGGLREEVHEELRLDPDRQRLHSGNANFDPFDISDIFAKYAPTRGDPARGNIDREIDFNWKRYETYGKPDYSEQRAYHAQGWRTVMHYHFPGRFAPHGTTGPVIVKDMILMERPMSLTVKARNEEIAEATRAMQVHRRKITATPEGSAPRIVYADRTTREAIEIPE